MPAKRSTVDSGKSVADLDLAGLVVDEEDEVDEDLRLFCLTGDGEGVLFIAE